MFRLCLFGAQIKQGETTTISFWVKDLSGEPIELINAETTPAYLTGGSNAESVPFVWEGVTDGSYRITINGIPYNVDGNNFTGDTTMDNVAATLQATLRTKTLSLETVEWKTDHFVITTVDGAFSAITVTSTSTGTVGTDISGTGWMDADAGNGVVTDRIESNAIVHITIISDGGSGSNLFDDNATIVDAVHGEISIDPGDTSSWVLDEALIEATITKDGKIEKNMDVYIWIYPS
jgi:hypothetical protein